MRPLRGAIMCIGPISWSGAITSSACCHFGNAGRFLGQVPTIPLVNIEFAFLI